MYMRKSGQLSGFGFLLSPREFQGANSGTRLGSLMSIASLEGTAHLVDSPMKDSSFFEQLLADSRALGRVFVSLRKFLCIP